MNDDATRPRIYTVGHSNRMLDEFVALIKQHEIEVLVDVRSQPYSRYTPQFNGASLKETMPVAGVRYLFLGKELGGRPEGARFYDDEGRVRYDLVAESPPFLSGIERLKVGIQSYRVAILCAEEDPTGCHRRLLVGRVLANQGIPVLHIRGDGRVQSEEQVQEAAHDGQLSLFGAQEVREWKSIRSVLPREARPASSEP